MKKLLSILICICFCFSLGTAAFANEQTLLISPNPAAKKSPVIIFKLDDLGATNVAGFQKAADECAKLGIKCSFGVIADRTMAGSKPSDYQNLKDGVFAKMREWYSQGIEIWHHGRYHVREEYSTNTYEQQLADFREAMQLIKSAAGITMTAFGSPFNNSTETTQKMIAENFPEIKVVMLAKNPNNANPNSLYITDSVKFEKDTGVVNDYESMIADYEAKKTKDVLIFQGHPANWSEESYENFRKLVEYLKADGCTFMTPTEYAGYDLPPLEEPTMTFEDKIEVRLDKAELEFDVEPQIINNRTMVPFRTIFEKLGAEITWDEATSTATGKKGDIEIRITNGSNTAYINGKETVTDVAPTIVDARFLVPVRFISETFGCYVYWDAAETTVFIVSNLTKQSLPEGAIEIKGETFNDFQYQADELGVFSYDGNEATVWSAEGENKWICYDLGTSQQVSRVSIMWNKGNARKAYYKVYTSEDGQNFTEVFAGESSGTNAGYEDVPLSAPVNTRYVKIECNGNSTSKWNAIKEILFYK